MRKIQISDILNSEKCPQPCSCPARAKGAAYAGSQAVYSRDQGPGTADHPQENTPDEASEEGQTVSLVPLGDVVIIIPRRLELDEARRRIAKILKESGVSAEEMLEGLVQEREVLYRERYGKKAR